MKTQLMGIINVTSDSFFDGGKNFHLENAIKSADKMIEDGVDIIDIGGESTRPGAEPIDEKEEIKRVIPLIKELKKRKKVPKISIDTSKSEVAKKAIDAGATLINDVTGLKDQGMKEVAKAYGVDVCVMHMQGNPRTMQVAPHYKEGIVAHLLVWFEKKIDELIQFGIDPKKIILDPGYGFGKSLQHNADILKALNKFKYLGFRILLGVSRKSSLKKILRKPTFKLLPATLAINTMAILAGVDIIRVHDVEEHRDVIDLISYITKAI